MEPEAKITTLSLFNKLVEEIMGSKLSEFRLNGSKDTVVRVHHIIHESGDDWIYTETDKSKYVFNALRIIETYLQNKAIEEYP